MRRAALAIVLFASAALADGSFPNAMQAGRTLGAPGLEGTALLVCAIALARKRPHGRALRIGGPDK